MIFYHVILYQIIIIYYMFKMLLLSKSNLIHCFKIAYITQIFYSLVLLIIEIIWSESLLSYYLDNTIYNNDKLIYKNIEMIYLSLFFYNNLSMSKLSNITKIGYSNVNSNGTYQ